MNGHLDAALKVGGLLIAGLGLAGGTVIGAARLSVAGVEAKVDAEKELVRERLRHLEDAQVEDRRVQRETLHSVDRKVDGLERAVVETKESVDLMRRVLLPRDTPAGPTRRGPVARDIP